MRIRKIIAIGSGWSTVILVFLPDSLSPRIDNLTYNSWSMLSNYTIARSLFLWHNNMFGIPFRKHIKWFCKFNCTAPVLMRLHTSSQKVNLYMRSKKRQREITILITLWNVNSQCVQKPIIWVQTDAQVHKQLHTVHDTVAWISHKAYCIGNLLSQVSVMLIA